MTSELRSLLERLPQRAIIPDERLKSWISSVRASDPERAVWHAHRLFGIGGSEAAGALALFSGDYVLRDARAIVASKLLMIQVDSSGPDAQRGISLEDMVRHAYLARFNATVDTESQDALRRMFLHGNPTSPWRRPNVDNIVLVRSGGRLRRCVVDYKVPRTGGALLYARHGMPFEYRAQLHYYAGAMLEAGLDVDGIILAPFDTDRWQVESVYEPVDPAMVKAVTQACATLWTDHVLEGVLPQLDPIPQSNRALTSQTLSQITEKFLPLKALADEAATRAEAHKAMIRAELDHLRMEPAEVATVNGVRMSRIAAQEYPPMSTLLELARTHGIDPETCVTARTPVYNREMLIERLLAARPALKSTLQDTTPSYRIALSQKQNTADAVPVMRARQAAENAVNAVALDSDPNAATEPSEQLIF
jgi:predicted phage-related endonuclease